MKPLHVFDNLQFKQQTPNNSPVYHGSKLEQQDASTRTTQVEIPLKIVLCDRMALGLIKAHQINTRICYNSKHITCQVSFSYLITNQNLSHINR